MKRQLLALVILVLAASCSITFPSQVGKANRAVISLLVAYTKHQGDVFRRTGAYSDPFSSPKPSYDADELVRKYAAVKKNGYGCRFDVTTAHFVVVCMPRPESGLQIGFYVDESRAIRLSIGIPDRSSPRLGLNPNEERELYGDVSPRF